MSKKMSVMDTNTQQPIEDFSAIKVFKYFEHRVEEVHSSLINSEKLQVNVDAYKELADDDGPEFVFARISYDFALRNLDLPFGMVFTRYSVGLSIGGSDYSFIYYRDVGSSEKNAAGKLANLLIALANGQIAALCTYRESDSAIQANEIIYRRPGGYTYEVLKTYAMFAADRKQDSDDLAVDKVSNSDAIKEVEVDIDLYKSFYDDESGWTDKYNRPQMDGHITPLSNQEWKSRIEQYHIEKTERVVAKFDSITNPDNKSLWEQMIDYSKWRHLELLGYCLLFVLFEYIREWSFDGFRLENIAFAVFVASIVLLRNKLPYRIFVLLVAPIAYAAFALLASIFFTTFDDSFWAWLLAVFAVGSIVECIVFDARAFFRSTVFSSKKGS